MMQRRTDTASAQQAGAEPRLPVDRLQGTDGIRRQTALGGDPRVGGLTPLRAYLERDLITEQFMEFYCYCHVASLIESGAARRGDAIVVGYDPRDPSRRFVEAVLAGVRKAGAAVVDVGILPTPAVALYMVARNAAGAIVITASHNGPDQNGIKLFLAAQGLKLFPADDRRLTKAVCGASNDAVAALTCIGDYLDEHAEAVEVFRRFCLDPRNSWLDGDAPAVPDELRNLVLVVDTANGALSELAAPILAELGAQVIPVNTSLCGEVNLNSGVADLEGTAIITAAMVHEAEGPFAKHEALRRLFAEGRQRRAAVQAGEVRVAAAVFDADGDRFYAVEYDAVQDRLLVLSGDEIACHQAAYLRRHGEAWRGALFVNTVESDLNAAHHAAALGFSTALTGVGDKWLLLRAWRAYLRAMAEAAKPDQPVWELVELCRLADALTTDPDVDGARLSRLLTQIAAKAAPAALLQPGAIPFAIGSEETGHCITAGVARCLDGRELPVFLGNGLKSAINTFAATQRLLRDCEPRRRPALLAHPFAPGHKRTFYAYYTRKAEFQRGSPAWVAVEELLRRQLAEGLRLERPQEPCTVRRLEFPEEPDMLYLGVHDAAERLLVGVFARNSGTEEKTGVNVRGAAELARLLDAAGEEALRLLLRRLKDASHPYARAERRILAHLARLAEAAGEQAEAGGAGCDEAALQALLAEERSEVNLGRLLHEMEARQGLLRRAPRGYALTERGAWYATTLGGE
ncbi:MAG: hypothetical protein HYY96_14730 [Candidatus Tectomicrobia bacterium]|nr:hypothetical protein [Candidatus Tectomicrobia bacterium]